MIAPCPSHESQAVAKKILKYWIRRAGPPDFLVCDGERGLGALEIFTEKLSVSGTQVQTTAADSPWQKGRVEQWIATIKEVAGKTILQHQVSGRTWLPTHWTKEQGGWAYPQPHEFLVSE